ncbi:MAG: tRNA pseudouridine(38-40) synthase TruA [Proteobacteria bacterium]|uniref:tRNA pseudouridine(38-40) synthase TruA n=1 Tax=Ottowia sp. TaxID=1898956 RepID=UPI001D936CB5|nr:tRNA pseudouridine(38-40) synthase TruA [Ottowia sp.]MBS0404346.1 tRNA pseudouridine(38-40) synthase TruA [Pseudomonadota bacterium]MBS0415333.1 tRNA pseudouridine(38-40) synthase TruA [Pseudomonadota bacterium]
MTRIALGLSFAGTRYHGWQSQPSGQTVQDRLERALLQFATQPLHTLCAGRTDAGVHGLMQVVHFDTTLQRAPFSWVRGTNRYLPPDIAVQWAQAVPDAFHARASALARRYTYIVLQSPVRPSLDAARVGWSFRPLDGAAMRAAAAHLEGEHDFSSFRASLCQALSPVKQLAPIVIEQRGAYWRFDFEANAFLHHMIRNIMGCLIQVGQGLHPPDWLREVLQARDRDAAAPTFAPDGLYFRGPVYAEHWGLPTRTAAYDWLP